MVWNSVRRFLCNPQFARSPNDQIAFCAFLFGAHLSLWYEVCHVLPYYYSTQMSPVALLHTTIAVGLYLNTLVNVYAMVRTRTACNLTVIGVGDENTAWPFCERCVGRQPPRSHHCPICDVCVLRRDHHCWFAGCCVGHANQRYYICAIMSMAVAAIYANVFHWQFVLDQLGRLGAFGMPACILVPHACALFGFVSLYEFLVTSLTFLALFVAVMLTWLTVLQLIQIRHGQTQYERKNGVKRYDNGLLCNIRTVFGDRWYVAWISPWIRSSLPENGAVFKVSGVKDK